MISRRATLAALAAGTLAPAFLRPALAAEQVPPPELTDDGLYRQPWFLDSFLELADDLEVAADAGKRFAVMWELKGCPYCKETHFTNFAKPEINRYVRENFDVLQLNIIGSRLVTDFDGEELSEKALAQKYGVRFTPTFQFFADSSEGLADLAPKDREVARAPGYLAPPHFLAMFRFVNEKAYENGSLRDYLRAQTG